MATVQHVPNFGHSHSHTHRIEIIEPNVAWFAAIGIIVIEDNGEIGRCQEQPGIVRECGTSL